jgi:hypothetical protein
MRETTMRINIFATVLCIALLPGTLALAQQPAQNSIQADQANVKKENKGKQKYSAPDDFGTLHDKAKKHGIDTSKPETLKGDVGGQIARKVKL